MAAKEPPQKKRRFYEESSSAAADNSISSSISSSSSAYSYSSQPISEFKSPTSNTVVSVDERRLDSLARILEGDSMCVAVCLIEDEIFVTSNELKEYVRGVPFNNENAKFMTRVLLHLLKEEGDDLALLSEMCFKKIKNYNGSVQDVFYPVGIQLDVALLEKMIGNLFTANSEVQYIFGEVVDIYFDEAEKRLWATKENPNSHELKALRKPHNKKMQLEIAHQLLWHLVRDFKKSIAFFKNKPIVACNLLAVGEENEHAERRMIGYLLETGNLSKPESMYIGISKLCCATCVGTVCVVNGVCKTNIGLMVEEASEEKTIEDEIELKGVAIELAKKEEGKLETTDKIEEDEMTNTISSSSLSLSNLEPVRTRGDHGLSFKQHTPKYLEGKPYISGKSYVKALTSADKLNASYSKFQEVEYEKTLSFFKKNEGIYPQLQSAYAAMDTDLSRIPAESRNIKKSEPSPTIEEATKRAKEEYTRRLEEQRSMRASASSSDVPRTPSPNLAGRPVVGNQVKEDEEVEQEAGEEEEEEVLGLFKTALKENVQKIHQNDEKREDDSTKQPNSPSKHSPHSPSKLGGHG